MGARQGLHDSAEVETTWFLPRRKLLEALQPLADESLRRDEEIRSIDPPARVTDPFVVGTLERVAAQVEQFRQTQGLELLLPDIETVPALYQSYRPRSCLIWQMAATRIGGRSHLMVRWRKKRLQV